MSNNENGNNNTEDDLVTAEQFDETAGFDDFQNKNTLGDLWRNNPMVKIGALLAVVAVVVGGIILFGGKSNELPPSNVGRPAEVTEAPGTAPISETYKQAVEEYNEQQVEEAISGGGSALPVPTTPQLGRIAVEPEQEEGEDPLERWRMMQEERRRAEQATQQQVPPAAPPPDTGRAQAVTALSNAMAKQMGSVLESQTLEGAKQVDVTSIDYLQSLQAQEAEQLALANAQAAQPVIDPIEIIVPAGTIEYAQLVTEANTDAPGPILARLVSGPLSGARLIGSFSTTEEDFLVLNFNVIVVDGISQPTSAVALDPSTTNPGLITEVDQRYFKRVILPAAAAFVEGLTEAISESGTTTITINDENVAQSEQDKDSGQEVASGIAEAGEEVGELLEEEADRTRPLLRVASGTPMGILFLQPVVENQ